MPIYEYRCDRCGDETEAIQKIGEAPLTVCPACGAESLKKKISAAVFRLKGKGWYETDFKSDRKKNVASDDDGATKEKENGKGKAQQQDKSESAATKSDKGGSSEKKAGDKSAGSSKPSSGTAAKD